METIKVELRAAAGGDDSKLLVEKMANIYQKCGAVNNFSIKIDQ